ncbi:MAG TPA: NnrU family protein [Burkholderiales bacterium]|nr:NnrU family protein [Burkholderiales bacterium]
MTALVAATVAFVLTHLASGTPLRAKLIAALGDWPYRGLYSALAFVTLGGMIWGYGRAPHEVLWAGWRHLPLVVMPLALILIVSGYRRNPTMVGADALLKSEDPARGMIRITRHPIMWGIMLWAATHILANGDLRSLVFFGGFLLVALLGTLSLDRRKRADPNWPRFAAATSHVPFVAVAQGRNHLAWREIGWTRPLIGLAAYAILLVLHPWLFGARPY